ncbi:MAG: ABC-type transport auxiliary lipoprotein family protein [Desulfobacterales bacterium]|nr:ABC-type transport auxiliary lipoprotein family protein [Desulfobacterales bacterium]
MKHIMFLTIVAAALAACVGAKGPPVESDIYALEYPAPAAVDQERRLAWSVRVDAFDAHPFIGTDRMAYRENAFKMETYRYHRWQAPPALLVAWHLERDLKSAGFCSAVIGSDSLLQTTHVIEGTVEEFYENDADAGWEAVLSISLTLASNRTEDAGRRILMQRRYGASRPCRNRTPKAVAEAMSEAMADVSQRALEDIYETLAEVK